MFFTYVGRELRRRRRQAVVVASGLALGIGLVVTVSAMASGVRDAQSEVLRSLYGVGTDITVTQAAAAGSGGPVRIGFNPGSQRQEGKSFSRDQVVSPPGLGTISASQVRSLSKLQHVDAVAGGLTLTSIRAQGRFASGPSQSSGTGGVITNPTALPSEAPVGISTYSITGVDVTTTAVGPISPSEVHKGRYFSSKDTNAKVAILDASYAKQKKLAVGDAITISGTDYTVIGIATSPTGGQTSNVYIPLARAQELAGLTNKVNRIYVKADSASNISAVKSEIKHALPKATVTTAKDLASQVTGSLSSASSLSGDLGRWLSIAALIAAFAVASLLTMAAVGRRTREFGTLKALGWRSRRVVGQVMGEAVVQGILGGVLGLGLGAAGAYLVSKLSPTLQATVNDAATGVAGPPGGPIQQANHTVSVPLTTHLSATLLLLAIGLALIGGVLAGSLGGWRAARLRPAEALRRLD